MNRSLIVWLTITLPISRYYLGSITQAKPLTCVVWQCMVVGVKSHLVEWNQVTMVTPWYKTEIGRGAETI